MEKQSDFDAIEARAFAARLTMKELCERVGVFPQSWSRAKANGVISVGMLKKFEDTLAEIEAETRSPAPV